MMRRERGGCAYMFLFLLFCRRTSGIRAWFSRRYNRGEKRKHCHVGAVYQNLIIIWSLFIQLHADEKFLQPQNFSQVEFCSNISPYTYKCILLFFFFTLSQPWSWNRCTTYTKTSACMGFVMTFCFVLNSVRGDAPSTAISPRLVISF